MKIDRSYAFSKAMRLKALEMAKSTGKAGAHLGGGFSSMDIIATLYGGIIGQTNRIGKVETDLLPAKDIAIWRVILPWNRQA